MKNLQNKKLAHLLLPRHHHEEVVARDGSPRGGAHPSDQEGEAGPMVRDRSQWWYGTVHGRAHRHGKICISYISNVSYHTNLRFIFHTILMEAV